MASLKIEGNGDTYADTRLFMALRSLHFCYVLYLFLNDIREPGVEIRF